VPAHARYIAALGGRYIAGTDMGTTTTDMDEIARWAPVTSSRRDPSRWTARGVVHIADNADYDRLSEYYCI